MGGEPVRYSLAGVRSDGWFGELARATPQFADIAEALGVHTLALCVIAGVRVASIAIDARSRDATVVSFTVGEDTELIDMQLGELRRRLVGSVVEDLLRAGPDATELGPNPSMEALQRTLGMTLILLSPVFGFGLADLVVGPNGVRLVVEDIGTDPLDDEGDLLLDQRESYELPLDLYRRQLSQQIASLATPQQQFAVDLEAIPVAGAHNDAGEFDQTIQLLGSWAGPLSLLLRTHEGQRLDRATRVNLMQALGYLGTAYAETGAHDAAEEVIRLGIQWGQEVGGPESADLFRRLGDATISRGRPGQAIGLLRRALSLGAPEKRVLPSLARCFIARERFLPALVCAEEAVALGVASEELTELAEKAMAALGPAWERFREVVPAPDGTRDTQPPPAP